MTSSACERRTPSWLAPAAHSVATARNAGCVMGPVHAESDSCVLWSLQSSSFQYARGKALQSPPQPLGGACSLVGASGLQAARLQGGGGKALPPAPAPPGRRLPARRRFGRHEARCVAARQERLPALSLLDVAVCCHLTPAPRDHPPAETATKPLRV